MGARIEIDKNGVDRLVNRDALGQYDTQDRAGTSTPLTAVLDEISPERRREIEARVAAQAERIQERVSMDPEAFSPRDELAKVKDLATLRAEEKADRRALWDETMPLRERDAAARRHMFNTLAKRRHSNGMDELSPADKELALDESIMEAYAATRRADMKAWESYGFDGTEMDAHWSPMALHKLVAEHAGLVNAIYPNVTKKMRFDPKKFSSQDITGMNHLQEEEAGFLAMNGRHPTRAERDEIADGVRMQFPAGHRPTIGFQNKTGWVNSTDEQDAEGNQINAGALSSTTFEPSEMLSSQEDFREVDEDPAAVAEYEKAVAEANAGDPAQRQDRMRAAAANLMASNKVASSYDSAPIHASRAAEREIKLTAAQRERSWDTYAATFGGPKVRATPMRKESSERSKALVSSYDGGVAGLARDILNKECRNRDQIGAIFAPFSAKAGSDLSVKDRQLILTALEKHPQIADKLWNSAHELASPVAE